MHYRSFGRTGWKVSEISFGAWAIGGSWGQVSDEDSMAALHQAIDCGVNFIDTADVYGDGRSERLIARLRKERKEEIIVATKAGRRLPRQTVEGYSRQIWWRGSKTVCAIFPPSGLISCSFTVRRLSCIPGPKYLGFSTTW